MNRKCSILKRWKTDWKNVYSIFNTELYKLCTKELKGKKVKPNNSKRKMRKKTMWKKFTDGMYLSVLVKKKL